MPPNPAICHAFRETELPFSRRCANLHVPTTRQPSTVLSLLYLPFPSLPIPLHQQDPPPFSHTLYLSHTYTHTHAEGGVMYKRRRKQTEVAEGESEEVSSIEWEAIKMTDQEEDLIYRMYRLVGDRWNLIAGRIPGRTSEEIERFWIMRHSDGFAEKKNKGDSTRTRV